MNNVQVQIGLADELVKNGFCLDDKTDSDSIKVLDMYNQKTKVEIVRINDRLLAAETHEQYAIAKSIALRGHYGGKENFILIIATSEMEVFEISL